VQNGTLKIYPGFPHGTPTTQAQTINADLLASYSPDRLGGWASETEPLHESMSCDACKTTIDQFHSQPRPTKFPGP